MTVECVAAFFAGRLNKTLTKDLLPALILARQSRKTTCEETVENRESQEAWRLYLRNWIPLGVMAVVLVLALELTEFSLTIESSLLKTAGTTLLFTVAAHRAILHRWGARPAFALAAIAQLGMLFLLAVPLTYIAAGSDFPLRDANLARFDEMLGLDWRGYFAFVYDRPALIPYVYIGYAMITWPMFGVPVVLAAARHYRRLQQFVLACMITVVVTAAISTLLPAIGTYHEYGFMPDLLKFNPSGYLVQLERLPPVRDGSLRILDPANLGGIITFPSFHAAAAVLALWALWSVWWLRPLALMANVAMLLATPLVGGHYFVDVFAGILLAVLAIVAARLMGEWWLRPTVATLDARYIGDCRVTPERIS
jgi:hypothetical protein